MNRICIFAKNKETYFVNRLINEVGLEAVSLFDPWSDFQLPDTDKYLVRTTGVYGSDLDLFILRSLPPKRIIGDLRGIERFRSKSVQYSWLEEEGLPILPWLPIKGTSSLNLEKFFRLYPMAVVKPLCGQGGWGIGAHDWGSFRKWWKKKKGIDEDYLLQAYKGGAIEYRSFFIGSELIVLRRKARSGITANFRKEGEAETSELPVAIKTQVQNLVIQTGLHYGALDILVDGEDFWVLEVNAAPGIEQLETVTGRNIMKELLVSIDLISLT